MKITSTCEKDFIVNCICDKEKRLDGRPLTHGRTLDIVFGQEWGCCLVSLGKTRVLAQVSCDITEPKPSTPTEGQLHLNLELSYMAAPDMKSQSRGSDEFVEPQRALERCIRDSKCLDLESLCIIAGSKVWTVRVDLHLLNDDGNIVECTSIAAISALAHFRRPDVTVVGTEVTVFSLDDRDPVPLSLHHMPVIVCLALFAQGEFALVDPCDLEEKSADGCYIIGMNAHQEICFVHRKGVLVLKEEVIEKCEGLAVLRAQAVTQVIRKALDDDAYKRATKAPIGMVNMLQTSTILGSKHPIHNFDLASITHQEEIAESVGDIEMITIDDNAKLQTNPTMPSSARARAMLILQNQEAVVFEGGSSKWDVESDNESESSEEETSQKTPVKKELDWSSEEEEVAYVNKDQVDTKAGVSSRGWYSKNPFS